MDEPIVFISHFRLAPDGRPAVSAAFTAAKRLMEETKPRTALYAAYLADAGRDLGIVHVFPDAAAMAAHFEGSADRARAVTSIMALTGFEVYGRGGEAEIDQLRHEADAAGVRLALHRDPLGGFLRGPDRGTSAG